MNSATEKTQLSLPPPSPSLHPGSNWLVGLRGHGPPFTPVPGRTRL